LHLEKQQSFYEPCTNIEIIQRVLRNLMVSFEKIGDHYKVDEIKRLLNSIL